jgi:hypothetical protein
MLKVIGGAQEGEFKAVASGTLPNGKAVIINSDGTASVAAETTASSDMTYGTFTNIENEATQHMHIAADPFNSNRFALVDVDDAGDKNVHLYIITRSGSSITVSSQIMVFASPGNNASGSMSVWDVVTENQLLICYNDDTSDFTAVVATISGSAGSETATFGSILDVSNLRFYGGTNSYAFIKPIGTTGSYLALYTNSSATNNYTYARILSISGTTVSRDTAGGSDGTVLVSVNMQPVMHADIDPNDSTKGFLIGVNDLNEDLEAYPLTFSGTGTSMTVSAGTKQILKSGRNFLDSHSSPTIKYLSSTKFFVAAQSAQAPNANDLETFLFDYDGSTYTEYTSVFLENPDGEILQHYVDTTSPQADENAILVTMNLNGSPRYVYGAVATCDTSANTVSYNTPARIDNFSGGNAGYISYATQSDANGTSLSSFSGTDGTGNQENYIGMSSGPASPSGFGTAVIYEPGADRVNDIGSTYDSTNNRHVIGYQDQDNANQGTAIVGTVSGNTVTFGTAVVFEAATTNYVMPVFDSTNDKVVIFYRDVGNSGYLTAIVGTVSGTSISFGTAVVVDSNSASFISAAFDSANGKVVCHWYDNTNTTGIVGTVSGTSISFGTKATVNSLAGQYVDTVYDSNAGKVVVTYRAPTTNNGAARVGTVSGTSISYGSEVAFNSGNTEWRCSVFDPTTNKIAILYKDAADSDKGKIVVGTVSGTSISFGSEVEVTSANMFTTNGGIAVDSNGKLAMVYRDTGNSNYGTLRTGTISGTTVTLDAAQVYEEANAQHNVITYNSTEDRMLVAYADEGNTGQGTARVYNVGFAGEVADGDPATIDIIGAVSTNQGNLTAGEKYYVQFDGTLSTTAGTPSVLAGTAISATKLVVKT